MRQRMRLGERQSAEAVTRYRKEQEMIGVYNFLLNLILIVFIRQTAKTGFIRCKLIQIGNAFNAGDIIGENVQFR